MDFAKLFLFQARLREQEPAMAFPGGVATYGVLARAVAAAAGRIGRIGPPPGSLVAVDLRHPIHHWALLLALALRGLPSASLQTAFNAGEAGLSPALILAEDPSRHPGEVAVAKVDGDWFIVDPDEPVDYASLLGLPGFGDETAMMRVVFSSGTTGVPKSTGFSAELLERRLAHAAFLHRGAVLGGTRAMTMMGTSTVAGFMLPLGVLAAGGVACFASHPAEALHIIRMFEVDLLILAVGQLQGLLTALGTGRAPGSLRTVIAGGARIPPELLSQSRARLCTNTTFGYGTTETGTVSHAPGSLLESLDGAAGHVVPWARLEVVDADDRPLPPGSEGIFRVRTDEQAHYVVESDDNRLLFRGGWFYPGDIGTVGADGLVRVTGRSVEVINRGGSIVAPDLIERVLLARPEIADAAAFGITGRNGIDDIWAAVVSPDGFDQQALIAYCREKLADKAPSYLRRVETIPRTPSGKIQRRQVRDEAVRSLGPGS